MAERPCPRSVLGGNAGCVQPVGSAALFLDRDGVVNVDAGYTHRNEDFVFMPGIFDLARRAVHAGLAVVVVTNQAGIGHGYYDEARFADLTTWMISRFQAQGVPIARVYFCPHHLEATLPAYRTMCPCRKPEPGMILAAGRELGLSLAHSVFIGDKASDMQAGAAAGVGTLALLGDQILPPGLPEVRRAHDLPSLADLLF